MNVLNSFIGTFSDDLSQWRILECMIYLKQHRVERCLLYSLRNNNNYDSFMSIWNANKIEICKERIFGQKILSKNLAFM